MRFGKRRGGEAPEGEPTVEAPPAPVVEPEPAAAEAEAVVEGEAVELPYEPPAVEEPPPEPVPAMSAYDAPVAAYEPPISDPVEPAPAARLADSPPYHEPGVNRAAGGAWPEPAFDPAERPEILVGAAFGGGLLLALILRRLGN